MTEDEYEYWNEELTRLGREELATIKSAADSWTKIFGALTGVFGTIAFAGGVTTLDKLASPWNFWIVLGTTVALACAVASISISASATGSATAETVVGMTPEQLRSNSITSAAEGAKRLGQARFWGIVAVAVILAGSLVLLWKPILQPAAASPDTFLVIDPEGGSACGPLTGDDGSLAIGDITLTDGLTELIPVETCPTQE